MIGRLLSAAYVHGRIDAGDAGFVLPEFQAWVTALTKRAAEIAAEYHARVVQSDPRTFERGK